MIPSIKIKGQAANQKLTVDTDRRKNTSLQRVQNAAARLVFGLSRFEHVTPTLIHLHWLPVSHRIRFKLCCLVHAIHYGRSWRIWRKQFSQSAPADHVPSYARLPPHRWTTLYHGCVRSSASGRSHMRVLPPGTLCPTTSAPWLILSSSENCLNHSILVKLLTYDDFCVSLCALASGWLL